MSSLRSAARTALIDCAGLKKKERFLVVTDKKKKGMARIFLDEAEKICDDCEIIEIPIGRVSGEEPTKTAADELKRHDVAFLITTRSLSHTKARREASDSGTRIASMPGITEQIIKRAIDVDYSEIQEMNKRLCSRITKGDMVEVTNSKGTDLRFSVKGRTCFDYNGTYKKKGSFGNLPAGESCIAPLETTAEGILVVDKTAAGVKKIDKLFIRVKKGVIEEICGGKAAEEFQAYFRKNNYGQVAEFGIGTNPKARATGCTLEDEKVLGTAHIAFGNNVCFGGNINVPLHLDCVFSKPSISVDGEPIMKKGRVL